MHLWAFNAGFRSRIDRCDFCGHWARVPILSEKALRAAEQAELAEAQAGQPIAEKTEEEKLKELIDESKYSNHS